MAITLQCGELGFQLEVDGIKSTPHRFDHAAVVKGPSGKFYCARVEDGFTGKPQVYLMTPVESVFIDEQLEEDVEGGYVEDAIYDDEEEDGEEGEEGEGDDEDSEEGEEDDDDDTTIIVKAEDEEE